MEGGGGGLGGIFFFQEKIGMSIGFPYTKESYLCKQKNYLLWLLRSQNSFSMPHLTKEMDIKWDIFLQL
jgi:hypothetical protein